MNFTKPIRNAISYARKEPVGAATVLIALDLAKKVAASSAGATVAFEPFATVPVPTAGP